MKTLFSNVAALLWSWPQMGSTHTHTYTHAHTLSPLHWLDDFSQILVLGGDDLRNIYLYPDCFLSELDDVTVETVAYVLTHYVSSVFRVTFRYLQWQLSNHNLFSKQCFVCTTDTHRVAQAVHCGTQAKSTSSYSHFNFSKEILSEFMFNNLKMFYTVNIWFLSP